MEACRKEGVVHMQDWKMYQGIEIVELDHKVKSRHPRWGYDPETLATLKDATLVVLADGTRLVICDDCGFNGLTGHKPYVKPEGEYKSIMKQADSMIAHKSGTHWAKKPRGSMYTTEDIAVAIKIWLKWKGTGFKAWGQAACDELERRGFRPYHSENWNPGQLSSLVRQYSDKPEFRNLTAAPMSREDNNLVGMVQEAVARESKGSNVAANARVTERKPTPADVKNKKAKKDEVKDVAGHEVPTLRISGGEGDKPAETVKLEPSSVVLPPVAAPALAVEKSDYKHITELPNGDPMFDYKGRLMVGKEIKGVEI